MGEGQVQSVVTFQVRNHLALSFSVFEPIASDSSFEKGRNPEYIEK